MQWTKTKLVATLGPASRDEGTVRALVRAGMDVARVNFSHGTAQEHTQDVSLVRRVAAEEGRTVAILADLAGPKLRVGRIDPEPLRLEVGESVTLVVGERADPAGKAIAVPHPELFAAAHPGDRLLLGDGAIELVVEKVEKDRLVCRSLTAGDLFSHKGIAAPRGIPLLAALTEKDRQDVGFALAQGVDFLALSFVRSRRDVDDLRSLVAEVAGDPRAVGIVAKIEKREALDHVEEILAASDAIMVARGDLGMEVPAEEVPLHQKALIRSANERGVPTITATQMLLSMVESPRPTRAETSDVANAILDGTDAVMLSEETAVGRHPVLAAEMMVRIAAIVEERLLPPARWRGARPGGPRPSVEDAISETACALAEEVGARLIVTPTTSGHTARQVAKWRPRQPIVALTTDPSVERRLVLSFGVLPILVPPYGTAEEAFLAARSDLLFRGLVAPGDLVVVTGGGRGAKPGQTTFLKVERIGAR